jgi:hypothetical protein
MRVVLLSVFCATLFGSMRADAQSPAQFLVDALGCEVPISTRYHVQPSRDGITFEIPHTFGTRIWIGPLAEHDTKPLDSQYRGAVKVEHYAPGCMAISPLPWVAIRGLHQEVDLVGLSDQEVTQVVEHCNATMNPEAIAIAARMAKGCAAVLRTEAATDALFGNVGLTKVATRRKGTARPFVISAWQIFQPELSPNLLAQHVNRGALVTSICGVPVSEVEESGATLCCGTAVDPRIDAILVEDGKSRSITGPTPHAATRPHVVDAGTAATGCGR